MGTAAKGFDKDLGVIRDTGDFACEPLGGNAAHSEAIFRERNVTTRLVVERFYDFLKALEEVRSVDSVSGVGQARGVELVDREYHVEIPQGYSFKDLAKGEGRRGAYMLPIKYAVFEKPCAQGLAEECAVCDERRPAFCEEASTSQHFGAAEVLVIGVIDTEEVKRRIGNGELRQKRNYSGRFPQISTRGVAVASFINVDIQREPRDWVEEMERVLKDLNGKEGPSNYSLSRRYCRNCSDMVVWSVRLEEKDGQNHKALWIIADVGIRPARLIKGVLFEKYKNNAGWFLRIGDFVSREWRQRLHRRSELPPDAIRSTQY